MNNKEKPWRWGKWKEERNPNQVLERNNDDGRHALISLLFSSLPLPLPSPFFDLVTHGKGAAHVGMGVRVRRGYCSTGYRLAALKKILLFDPNSNHDM